MRTEAIFWVDRRKVDLDRYANRALKERVSIRQVNDIDELLTRLNTEEHIDVVLTIVDVTDIAALYHIHLIKAQRQDITVIAIFDTGSDSDIDESAERLMSMLYHHTAVQPEASHANQSEKNNTNRDAFGCSLLTKRQIDVLKQLGYGKSNKQIARDLNLCEGTVKAHCMAIFKTIGVRNRTEAAFRAEALFGKKLCE